MKSHKTRPFDRAFDNLPRPIQERAREAYRIFVNNPHDPRLHFKQIHSSQPIYSVRIGYRYRALGIRDGDEIVWFWIGSHADYDNMISQM